MIIKRLGLGLILTALFSLNSALALDTATLVKFSGTSTQYPSLRIPFGSEWFLESQPTLYSYNGSATNLGAQFWLGQIKTRHGKNTQAWLYGTQVQSNAGSLEWTLALAWRHEAVVWEHVALGVEGNVLEANLVNGALQFFYGSSVYAALSI